MIYSQSSGVWSSVALVVGTPFSSTPEISRQGFAVSTSFDGKRMIAGASTDNAEYGAGWAFRNSGGSWSQVGNKFSGTQASTSTPMQGSAVAISGDGNVSTLDCLESTKAYVPCGCSQRIPLRANGRNRYQTKILSATILSPTTGIPSFTPAKSPTASMPTPSPSMMTEAPSPQTTQASHLEGGVVATSAPSPRQGSPPSTTSPKVESLPATALSVAQTVDIVTGAIAGVACVGKIWYDIYRKGYPSGLKTKGDGFNSRDISPSYHSRM